MQNQQLDLFEDNSIEDAPNVVEPDFSLEVDLSFTRFEDGVQSFVRHTLEGERAESLDHVLPMMTQFLRDLGFTYVHGLVAVNEDGNDI